MPTLPITSSSSSSTGSGRALLTPRRYSSSTSTLPTRSMQMKSMLRALLTRQSSSSALMRWVLRWRREWSSRRRASSFLRASRERSQEQEVKGCRMLLNLLKMLVRTGAAGRVVSWISRSFTRCRYSCNESISSVKYTFRKRFRTEFTSFSYFYRPSSARHFSLRYAAFTPFRIINQIPTNQLFVIVHCHSSQITVTGRFFSDFFLGWPVGVWFSFLIGLSFLIGFSFLVVAFVPVVVVVIVVVEASGLVLTAIVLVLGLVLLVLLGLGLADGVPELLLLVLLGLGEVLILEEDLADAVALEGLFRDLLIVRDEVLIELVAEVLHVFEDDDVVFVVDAGEQAFEALSALELDVDLVGEEVLDGRDAHDIFK